MEVKTLREKTFNGNLKVLISILYNGSQVRDFCSALTYKQATPLRGAPLGPEMLSRQGRGTWPSIRPEDELTGLRREQTCLVFLTAVLQMYFFVCLFCFLKIYFFYVHMCVYVNLCAPHAWRFPERREGVGFPGTRITGLCEPSHMGAGSQARVLCKSSKCCP